MSSILFLLCTLSCFYSINGLVPRINNGKLTSSSNFPYVVGIQVDTLLSTSYCTGGVVGEKYVLTAAHCFAKKLKKNPTGGHKYECESSKVRVYANTDSMKKISENAIPTKGTDVYFTKQFSENGVDDIAILKLDQSLNLGAGRILKLPQFTDEYLNRLAVIAGYGDDPEGDKKNKEAKRSLKTMNVKVVHSSACSNTYKPTGVPVNSKTYLCTKAVELDYRGDKRPDHPLGTCRGDSGAPILYQRNTVIGVVSGGLKCDGRDNPEQHINISNYLTFINTVINEKTIDENHIKHCVMEK